MIACKDTKDAHSFDDKVVNDSHIFNLNLCIQVTVQNKIIGQKIGIKFECENGRVKRNAEFFNSIESTEFDNTSNPLNKKALYTIER